MATKNQKFRTLTEFCGNCGRETSHQVSVQIRTESKKKQNAEFSREPYRVTECLVCNETSSQRMNNA
jgi:formate dehydrogenase assembly factor FdhD